MGGAAAMRATGAVHRVCDGPWATSLMTGIAAASTLPVTANGPPVLYPTRWREVNGSSTSAAVPTRVLSDRTLLFPYHGPPMVLASERGGVRLGHATRLTPAFRLASGLIAASLGDGRSRLIGRLP